MEKVSININGGKSVKIAAQSAVMEANMTYENIIFQVEDDIAVITLNRPKSHNALCRAINNELENVLEQLSADAKIRALILTGGTKTFAAGADITEMMTSSPLEAEKVSAQAHKINDMLESLPVPVIGAINGMALGGGFELALACDFRVVGENAVFGLPEVGLGILPGAGGTQRLTKLIGAVKAKEMVMLGKKIKGKEAFDIGIATTVVSDDQVMDEAMKIAQKLKEKPAAALNLAKTAINYGVNNGIGAGKLFEKALFALTFSTADQKEGMSAFAERRTPEYEHIR